MAGNANSGRKQEKPFRDALRLELAAAEKNERGLRLIARKLIEAAEEGKMDAVKEIADRTDGKVAQAIIGGDDDDNPISVIQRIERHIVRANSTDPNG
ncbi:hypothetical protein [Rhizobium ecuadorense]|uniref:hypothetical protein n=1 Tax=Rhizobium ecuadorense TaxID=1671795 RepID=UPI0006731F37|nr:hypothetical protein [Rhizobium ecuadorense]